MSWKVVEVPTVPGRYLTVADAAGRVATDLTDHNANPHRRGGYQSGVSIDPIVSDEVLQVLAGLQTPPPSPWDVPPYLPASSLSPRPTQLISQALLLTVLSRFRPHVTQYTHEYSLQTAQVGR